MPKVSSILKNMDDEVKFVSDMEEPVCEGSVDDNHQQKQHPHKVRDAFFELLKVFTK